jgi:hypothetical protein
VNINLFFLIHSHFVLLCVNLSNIRTDAVRGGALYADPGSGMVTIKSCTFEDNYAGWGGAVNNAAELMHIESCEFIGNGADVVRHFV